MHPELAALIERERELRLSQVRGLLTCHAPRAARVITEMMVDDGVPAADRRQAAVKVLEFAGAASAQQIRVEQRIVGESLSVATPELLADLLARAAAGEAVVLPDDDEEKEP